MTSTSSLIRNIFSAIFFFALAHSARAESPRVAATISPVHSLAAFLMSGGDGADGVGAVGGPELLVAGGVSPHHFHLRPSGAAILEDADVIFWVSENLESSLAKAIAARAKPGAAVELLAALDADSLIAYEDEDADEDGHSDGHGDDEHDEHDDEHGHGDDEHGDEHGDDEHDEGHGHGHGDFDPHVWLSPALAGEMAAAMAAALIRADGKNAELYRRNLGDLRERLGELDAELRGMLSDLPPLRAFVFHDAYGYFQRAYDLRVAGAILGADAETHGGLSAARVAALREIAEEEGVVCVFAEPQFNRRILTPIMRGFEMEILILDPLGAEIPPGADAYFQTMRNMAKGFAKCAKK